MTRILPGKGALIVAAAGGVGIWLVQLARIAGLEVVAQVGSAKNDTFVRGLGASETVNYKIESLKEWAEREGPVDIVIDLLGGKTLEDAWYCVKDGGTLISIFEPPEGRRPEGLKNKVVKIDFFIMGAEWSKSGGGFETFERGAFSGRGRQRLGLRGL